MQLFFLKYVLKLLKFFARLYWFIINLMLKIYFFIKNKFKIYYVAFIIRKKQRSEFYKVLYINYYFFYKKRSLIENEFYILNEKDLIKYTNQAISLTFNFYSFNFKFIYF